MHKHIINRFAAAALLTAAVAAVSCSESRNGWSVSGTIEGAADSTLFIEESSGAAWIIVDSLTTDKAGNFRYTARNPLYGAQQIYRLRLADRAVYFPIENSDAVTITARNTDMDSRHTIGGTTAAQGFNTVDSLISDATERLGVDGAINDPALFSRLAEIVLNDSTCIVGYYTVMHPVDNKLLFNDSNPKKTGLIGAVATRYRQLRPSDPRGNMLEQLYTSAKRRGGKTSGGSMEAAVAGRPVIDFVRQDEKGNDVDLNAVLDRGSATLVNLIRYDDRLAPANTAALGEVYDKYKNRGLEIVQIGVDPNRAHWQQNALSMPWITVYSAPDQSLELFLAYNVDPVEGGPTTLLFNRSGELVKRVTNPADIDAAVASIL